MVNNDLLVVHHCRAKGVIMRTRCVKVRVRFRVGLGLGVGVDRVTVSFLFILNKSRTHSYGGYLGAV